MHSNPKVDPRFLNPYRQNRRCFFQYFNNSPQAHQNSSQKSSIKQYSILDNISRTSSVKLGSQPLENLTQNKINRQPQFDQSFFIVTNKRQTSQLSNPELFELVSKHLDTKLPTDRKSKKRSQRSVQKLLSQRNKQRAQSVQQIQKTPKITQFMRQTFYRNNSSNKQKVLSKKQIQDILHCNNNLEINTKKHHLGKKTRPQKDGNSFVTYQIYELNGRVGIDAQILAGGVKQIKFRLIMNESDSKTFDKHWRQKINQFIEKCLAIGKNGISLKFGAFNFQILPKNNSSRINNFQKTYLQHYESLMKRQRIKKKTKKIGNIQFHLEYQPQQNNQIGEKKIAQKINASMENQFNKVGKFQKIKQKDQNKTKSIDQISQARKEVSARAEQNKQQNICTEQGKIQFSIVKND